MRKTVDHRRRALGLIVSLFVAIAVLVSAPAAAMAPSVPDEGGSKKLRAALESAAKGHLEAKAKLEHSQKRQVALGKQLTELEARLTALSVEVSQVAAESYRLGRISAVSMLLNSSSPDSFLERAAGLDMMAQRDGRRLREYTETRDLLYRTKVGIDQEVREQQKQLNILAKKKREAELALAAVSSGSSSGWVAANSPLAKPAPRNADGSWPSESCSVNDPTTDGCITPRTLHARNQALANGFDYHHYCHRDGGGGEHPKGRACDFSSAKSTFRTSDATGAERTYGNNLAAFFVKNASRLGVMYVIWYRQIWMPNTGWRSYSGGGDAASDHTNHVHLSML